MKKVLRKVFAASAVLVMALTAGIFAGCKYGVNQEELKKQQGYSCVVTYDANGGTFGSGSTRTYALVKEKSPTPAPGYGDSRTQATVKLPTRVGYELIGESKVADGEDANNAAIRSKSWFLAETDENGDLIYEGEGEEKTVKLASEKPWDFAKDKVTEDITLVAQWREVLRYVLCMTEVDENGQEVEKEIRAYTVDEGDIIADKLYDENDDGDLIARADYIRVKAKGYTLLGFYMDKDLTQPLDVNYQHPGSQDGVGDVKIYAKYLKGDYDLISNDNMETLTSVSKWYLTEDIDLTGQEWGTLSSFSGEIIGNGFALKNLTVKSIADKENTQHSIFGTMNGTISNVIFENVTLKITTKMASASNIPGQHSASFLAKALGAKAKLENVTMKDCGIVFANSTAYEIVPCEGLLWTTAAEGYTATNLTIVENDVQVERVKVENV